jgi:hypothetical protein
MTAKTVGFTRKNSKDTRFDFAQTKINIFRCYIWYLVQVKFWGRFSRHIITAMPEK